MHPGSLVYSDLALTARGVELRGPCPSSATCKLNLRLMDSCIIQLKAQGSSETCNESKEEEEVSTFQVRSLQSMCALYNTCTLSTNLDRKGTETRLSTKFDMEGQSAGSLR